MKPHAERLAPSDAGTLRVLLRAHLRSAMKARHPHAVSALRTAIAAIDNAEAVVAPTDVRGDSGEHFAGARDGVGSTEAPRRVLTHADVRALLEAEISDRLREATRYEAVAKVEAAHHLRQEADAILRVLAEASQDDPLTGASEPPAERDAHSTRPATARDGGED